ncbi:MAG: TRAP transporter small permease subunit [Candidatus Symbiobacter sp.]|nr:TRAP transporter small permease subunit [Candidatus Symbiobacter sp.]
MSEFPSQGNDAINNQGHYINDRAKYFALALRFSNIIDRINNNIGKFVMWLVLITVIISCANALSRKILNLSSNAFFELQWYGFAAIFMLGGGYTLLKQAHVRIDVVLLRFARRTQVKIEIFGLIFFLFPMSLAVIYLSVPTLLNKFMTGEMSSNAGGLIRWPVYSLMPIGFFLLALQGISELIKRFGHLAGLCDDPGINDAVSNEEILADELRKQENIK